MGRLVTSLVAAFCSLSSAPALAGQTEKTAQAVASPQASARTDVYHVQFAKAALGKTSELLDILKSGPPADPKRPNPEVVILRHEEGDDWDFVVIEHMGPSAAVDASLPPGLTPEVLRRNRAARDWHSDTFVAGPPLAQFKKTLGLDTAPDAARKAVYIVSQYRSASGHRDDLEKTLNGIAAAARTPDSTIQFQHLEGGAWEFLTISRHESWTALAADMTDPAEEERLRGQGFTRPAGEELRAHMATHHDTIASRELTKAQEAKKTQ